MSQPNCRQRGEDRMSERAMRRGEWKDGEKSDELDAPIDIGVGGAGFDSGGIALLADSPREFLRSQT